MPFAPGQSGNPDGAPRRPHKRTAHIRALVRDKIGVLAAKTIAKAEAGDVESLRLFYRYLMPRHHFVPGHDPDVLKIYPAAKPGMEDWIVRLDVAPKV